MIRDRLQQAGNIVRGPGTNTFDHASSGTQGHFLSSQSRRHPGVGFCFEIEAGIHSSLLMATERRFAKKP